MAIITIDNQEYRYEIMPYANKNSLAIQLWQDGMPYARLTTNPEFKLTGNLCVIRDDETYNHHIVEAMVQQGVLGKTLGRVAIGYTTGTVYAVNLPDNEN